MPFALGPIERERRVNFHGIFLYPSVDRLILYAYPVIVRRRSAGDSMVASVRTVALQRVGANHVSMIAPDVWDQFIHGAAPLRCEQRKVDLLLLTVRDGVCEEIDPISVDLDEHGYLMRLDGRLRPLPDTPVLIDARHAFLARYMKHAHQWQPTPQLIDQALALAGRSGLAS